MSGNEERSFASLVNDLLEIIDLLVLVVFAITFIMIMWGTIQAWIIKGGDASEVEKGRKIVTVGIIALVVMTGIWGILAILRNSLF